MLITASKIKVGRNDFAIVNEEDLGMLNKHRWYLSYYKYAVSNENGRKIFMHRLVNKTPEGKHTDHVNGDRLDNRKDNLRSCTASENLINRGKQKNNTSGYKGVIWHKQLNKWWARLQYRGKQISLGLYTDKKEAALAYNRGATEYFGDYAKLNEVG